MAGFLAPRHALGFKHLAKAQGGDALTLSSACLKHDGGWVESLALCNRHQPYFARTPLQATFPSQEAPSGHGACLSVCLCVK